MFLIQPMVYIKNNIYKNEKVFLDTLVFNISALGLICIYLSTIPYLFSGYAAYERSFYFVLTGMICIPVFYIVSFMCTVIAGMVVAVDNPYFSLAKLYKVILLVNCTPFFCEALFLFLADLFQENTLFLIPVWLINFLLEVLVLRFYYYALTEYISVGKAVAMYLVLITLLIYLAGGILCGIIG